MRKRDFAVISAISAGAAAAVTYLLQNKATRDKLRHYVNTAMNRGRIDEDEFPIDKAGYPGANNPSDSKMVSEGAQFGVQYYNHVTEEGEVKR